jgi:hypothetical protein
MGKMRSLTSDEIIAQFFFAKKISRTHNLPEIRNIVFMGMGEPADNAENVVRATNVLTTRELFQISAMKVTGTYVLFRLFGRGYDDSFLIIPRLFIGRSIYSSTHSGCLSTIRQCTVCSGVVRPRRQQWIAQKVSPHNAILDGRTTTRSH